MARPDPPQLEAIYRASPAEARPVILHLAALEAKAELTSDEMHELNGLRIELDRWPLLSGALAHAYMASR